MSFPEADTQAQADNCFLISRGDDMSPHWLVYEVARDFLSAPRTFAVCRLTSEFDFDWTEAAEGEADGITQLADHQGVPQWQIRLPRLEFICWGEMSLVRTVYGAASADAALLSVPTQS